MLVQKDSTFTSLGLVLMIALLQSACATASSEQMFRFDAAPFDRPAPDVSLLGTNTQTSPVTRAPAKRAALAMLTSADSSEVSGEASEPTSTELPATETPSVDGADTAAEGKMCLAPSALRERAEVNPEFWEALECGQSNHYLGAQVGFGGAIASMAVLSLVASLSGDGVTQASAILGAITIPPALLAGTVGWIYGKLSETQCRRKRRIAGFPSGISPLEVNVAEYLELEAALNKLRARDALPTRQLRKFKRLEEEQKTLIAQDPRIMDSAPEAGCLEITPLIARTEELKRLRAKETLSPREARRLERLERLEQEASDAQ